jgi:mono/diheme cytochrome c family protein
MLSRIHVALGLCTAAACAMTVTAWLEDAGAATTPPDTAAIRSAVARGRYLVVYGACNDCHTPGWRESDGTLPAARWLTGSKIGFRGAWGTSYPVNLRLEFQTLAEDQWLIAVRTRGGHPPMTWHDLRVLSASDRHAIYAFIKSLGPAGVPAPFAIPPWRTPVTPYIETRPQPPPRTDDPSAPPR